MRAVRAKETMMGGDTGRGADVYLETHGESVFKRLCHIMILVKEDLSVDTQ